MACWATSGASRSSDRSKVVSTSQIGIIPGQRFFAAIALNKNIATGIYSPTTLTPPTNKEHDISAVLLTSPVEAYEVKDEQDTIERYEQFGTVWRLISIKQRGGYTQTFAYDAAGLLTTISDTLGRTLTFTFEPALPAPGTTEQRTVQQIDAPSSFQITYNVPARNFIDIDADVSEHDPEQCRRLQSDQQSGCLGNHDLPLRDDSAQAEPACLTGITDARGIRFGTYTYDSAVATVSEHSGSNDRTTFTYDDVAKTTTVTNALNKSATYNFQTINSKRKISSVAGIASTNCPASSVANVYDPNGRC